MDGVDAGRPALQRGLMARFFAATAVAVSLAVSLGGCVTLPQMGDSGRPKWIDDPGNGVSASAGEHVRGRQAQEELAISRARDEFARRQGVRVSNMMVSDQTVSGGRLASSAASTSTQAVSDSDVKAMVKAKWIDPNSGVLWVWMVPGDK